MISTSLGTAHLSDAALVEEFESCRLPAAHFHHADHIRLAWIYLGQFPSPIATDRIEQSIRRFANHNGVGQRYHHTITVAWMKLVAAARRANPQAARFEDFAAAHPGLFDVKSLERYYTPERLAASEARAGWIEPDLRDLP
jgi:hypothetical protein